MFPDGPKHLLRRGGPRQQPAGARATGAHRRRGSRACGSDLPAYARTSGPFATPAADAYHATPAVTNPAQPPACSIHGDWPWAMRKKPITSRISVISSQEHAEDRDVHAQAPEQHVRVEDRERE